MTALQKNIAHYFLNRERHIAPLAVFRVLFGGIMFISILRFVLNGWVYDQYIAPEFHFSYPGLEWVQPPGPIGMYLLFAVVGLAALFVAVGLFYRLSIVTFFLGFTYIELIDKTYYLNHYYFVSIIAFLLILVPAGRYFSLDIWLRPSEKRTHVPAWMVDIFKLQLALVYFFAGFAKLNANWLFDAMPLKIWLPSLSHLPLIGWTFDYEITAYLFSWGGAIYDLTIWAFLLYRPTRKVAYAAVLGFHLMTALMFQIGMFPYIMVLLTLIFFSEDFHKNLLKRFSFRKAEARKVFVLRPFTSRGVLGFLSIYFVLQLLLPLRFTLYPGDVFWNEEGYRFSWRVMLMEKSGYATFYVKDKTTGKQLEVTNGDFLTPVQEKMMVTQPDMILQYGKMLGKYFEEIGWVEDAEVRVKSYANLNGQGSRVYIHPEVDLMEIKDGWHHRNWVIPFDQTSFNYASGTIAADRVVY